MKKIISILVLVVMVCAVAVPSFATEASFTVFSDEEYDYYYFDMGSSDSGGSRFHDGYNYIIYEFPIAETDTHAQLSWHIRNQYQVSVTNTDPDDPDAFEVIHQAEPTEAELAAGTANWGDYGTDYITVHDLSKWCIDNPTGKIWVMMADADPTNGWGGLIYNDTPVTFWSGSTEAPEVEQPKTIDELAEETLAKYTFPEGSQYFICSSASEKPFLYKEGGAVNGSFYRFMDGTSYTIYQFDVKASDTQAILRMVINNQYDIRATMGDPENIDGYTQIALAAQTEEEAAAGNADWGNRYTGAVVDEATGEVITEAVIPQYDFDLSSVLNGTDGKLYVYIGDCTTENGWGACLDFYYPVEFSTTGNFAALAGEEAPAEEVVETPVVEEPVVEEVVETPAEEVVETPAEEVVETPAEEVVETPVEEVVEAPAEEVVETPVAQAPQTFDAAVVAVLAVVTAFGGAVVSKKRH